jgi:hypothetical protein
MKVGVGHDVANDQYTFAVKSFEERLSLHVLLELRECV